MSFNFWFTLFPCHNHSWSVFSMEKSLFTRCLRTALVFAILTIALLILESLLGNTPVNGNSPKVSGYLSLFLYLILLFVVSHVNLLHIYVSILWHTDAVYLISSAFERIVRFATSANVVLEDYTSCLPNKKFEQGLK